MNPALETTEIRTTNLPEKVNLLIEKLSPEVFKDDDGNDRASYSFSTGNGKPVKVIFYSPGEIPYNNQVTQDRRSFVIGEQPKWRDKDVWQGFLSKVKQDSKTTHPPTDLDSPIALAERIEAVDNERATFFVESGPRQLLDIAFVLGVEDPIFGESRKLATNKRLDDTANALIDRVIALKAQLPEKSHHAEALLLLALQGDQKARDLLDQTLKIQEKKDQVNREQVGGAIKEWVEGRSGPTLNLNELIAVHVTRFYPKKGQNGLEMSSTFDGTDWQVPRDTVHFSLNHPVEAHMFGNWDDTPIAVIAPLDKMIGVNGKPLVLNTVDTFFEVSPGTRIKLPEGSVIVRPDKLPEGQLFRQEQGAVVYKAANITPTDIQNLISLLGERERDYFNEQLWRELASIGSYHLGMPTEQREEIQARWLKLEPLIGSRLEHRDMLQKCAKQNYQEIIKGIIETAELTQDVPPEMVNSIISKWGGAFINKIKVLAIRDQIKKMGCQVQPGGMWAWGDSWDITHRTYKLGAKLGIDVSAHANHWSKKMEEGMIGGMGVGLGLLALLESGEITPAEYRDRTFEFVKDNFDRINPATRRMFYLFGAI